MTSAPPEAMVRMGELFVSRTPGQVLASIGLGSCIGLVLFESARPLAGLAHIMLPASNGDHDSPSGKFADRAVPALVAELTKIGATATKLEAVLVGGARMFSFGSSDALDIGRRNDEATRAELKRLGISIRAAATGGGKGRTVRVHVDTRLVTVKEPGAAELELFAPAAGLRRTA